MNNFIRTLEAGIFSGLKQLQVVDLSYNCLENLPDITFQDNHKLEVILLNNNNLEKLERNFFSHLKQLKIIRLSMNNLTFIHPNTFTGLNNLRSIHIYGNQIPCSCSFLRISKNLGKHAQLTADCFLHKQPSRMISRTDDESLSWMWSNWTEISCTKSSYIRVRLCPDCSKKRHHTHCSHHTRSGNSTCVMVEGRGGTFKPRFASKRGVIMDCKVECLSMVNVTTITLILIGSIVIGSLIYFMISYRTRTVN